MMRAMKKMYGEIEAGRLSKDEVTEEVFSGYLDTADLPDPDLFDPYKRGSSVFPTICSGSLRTVSFILPIRRGRISMKTS